MGERGTRETRLRALTEAMLVGSRSGAPVSRWALVTVNGQPMTRPYEQWFETQPAE